MSIPPPPPADPNTPNELPADTRARVLLEAAQLFAARGFDAPSVREICAAAGVSKPTLYYHFASKSGLITAVIEALHADFRLLIAELFDVSDASVAGCELGYARLLDRVDEQGWTARLWSRIPALNHELNCCGARERKAEAHLITYLQQIPDLPPHTDVAAAAWLLLASFGPIATHKNLVALPLSNAQLGKRLVRQALGVARPTQETP